ncbi:hypothetical protein SAMN04487983_10315 [Streptomyces sp. yr375]|uniref:hypothetical protein n=1 Tax=Streptomyces sp. yr375 TaxID=1761906 RepID=UPI0008BDF263|nr:hypothetical protein [Streptomyces sp. yr375]SES09461.1 hypothetical protein SAMN04487983_10315 [Streptomyces sp. yr375]
MFAADPRVTDPRVTDPGVCDTALLSLYSHEGVSPAEGAANVVRLRDPGPYRVVRGG